jgi:carnitine O-acetyltransferase
MRATSLILSTLGFIHDLRTSQLEPDSFRGVPLDMSQYLKLFGTARVPTKTGCRLETERESRHVVVLARGQAYWFDVRLPLVFLPSLSARIVLILYSLQVLDSKHRPVLTERALLANLTAILSDASLTPPNQVSAAALGVLTTESRPVWAGHRATLEADEGNKMCLEVIDKALFVVALDDTSPKDASEMCSNMLCGTYRLEEGVQVGTCTNRWYDKVRPVLSFLLSLLRHYCRRTRTD